MPRRFATIAAFMSVLALSIPAAAQVTRDRDPNPALWQSTPDAAALGPAGRGFLEFGHTDWDGDWLASAGLGVKGGMLHFTYGQSDLYRDYALGYARRIVEHSLGVFGSWGTGIDFTGAHQTGPGPFGDATAARLTIPLSLRWGSPSGLSISPYVAPYAEMGNAEHVRFSTDCSTGTCTFSDQHWPGRTYSTGIGIGAQITAWRLGLTVGAMGVPMGLRKYGNGQWQASAGVRVRF
jgi:hypothetical protein